MIGNTDMHLLITDTFKKRWIRKPVSIWCDHHLCHAARHLLHIELIRLLIVACGMLSHSSSMAVSEVAGYWRELEHAVVHIDTEHPKHGQWVPSLVSMQVMEELGHFQLP